MSNGKSYVLDRIGGEPALQATVAEFYSRLIVDEKLEKFFRDVDVEKLKTHQFKFLKLALTKIPSTIDVPKLLLDKHARLFDMGLDETHFDVVAGHLVDTLKSLGVSDELVGEVVGIVGPLRGVFAEGAKIAKGKATVA